MPLDKQTATTMNRMQKQITLQEIQRKNEVPEEEPTVEIATATKFRLMKDITLSLVMTGAVRLRAGQVIEDPRLLYALRQAQAELRPIA